MLDGLKELINRAIQKKRRGNHVNPVLKKVMVCAHFIHGIVIGMLGEARGGDFVLYKKSGLYFSSNFISPQSIPPTPSSQFNVQRI